jgi:hypothetical protein
LNCCFLLPFKAKLLCLTTGMPAYLTFGHTL